MTTQTVEAYLDFSTKDLVDIWYINENFPNPDSTICKATWSLRNLSLCERSNESLDSQPSTLRSYEIQMQRAPIALKKQRAWMELSLLSLELTKLEDQVGSLLFAGSKLNIIRVRRDVIRALAGGTDVMVIYDNDDEMHGVIC
ncbi:MAG: hypothetical protein [Circoviridae sp.]|nr:MAG: hypothetical protein [Circoviridae sp.]